MAAVEDVVVYLVARRTTEGTIKVPIASWGRDTADVARAFIASPKWPAHYGDAFIAVDDWGHGTIIAASEDVKAWVGKAYRDMRQAWVT
jgi:hypothetical protein